MTKNLSHQTVNSTLTSLTVTETAVRSHSEQMQPAGCIVRLCVLCHVCVYIQWTNKLITADSGLWTVVLALVTGILKQFVCGTESAVAGGTTVGTACVAEIPYCTRYHDSHLSLRCEYS